MQGQQPNREMIGALEVTAYVGAMAGVGFLARREIRHAFSPPHGTPVLLLTCVGALGLSTYAFRAEQLGGIVRLGLFLLGPFVTIMGWILWSEERKIARGWPLWYQYVPENLSAWRRVAYGGLSVAYLAIGFVVVDTFGWAHLHAAAVSAVAAFGYAASAVHGRLPRWFRRRIGAEPPERELEQFNRPRRKLGRSEA